MIAAVELAQPPVAGYFQFAPDIKVAYEVRGSGGPVIVFLHGFGASRESWYDIAPTLKSHAQIYLLDLLGFGRSSKPSRGDYSVAMQATIVAKFLSTFNLRNVVLVGHSYGGGVALRTFLDHEEASIARLVLIDAAGYQQPLPFFVGTLRVPLLNRIMLRTLPAAVRARITLRHLFFDRSLVTPDRVHRYAQYFDVPGAHASFIAAARHLIPTDHGEVVSRIKSIHVPTLIIWGQNDAAINVANAFRFAGDIAGATLHVVPRCGHIPHEEKPEEVASVLLRFVTAKP